jgi:LmbE family N-acetylglucosaminyl deacetylase
MSDLAEFPDGWRRASVIVAHPDDIEYGVAGAVAAWTAAGREVSYVLVTSGEAGIDSIEFLGHPDGRIVEDLGLRRDLAAAIRRQRPDVVVAQFHGEHWGGTVAGPWNSADHRAVGRATMDAVGDAANRWIFPELDEEPWAGTQWIAVAVPPADATHAVDLEGVAELAIDSLLAHEAYLRGLGVEDHRAYAVELLDGQAAAVAPRFGGRRGVAFAVTPGPGAPP